MAGSKYIMTIERQDREPVYLIPGGSGELDMVNDIRKRVVDGIKTDHLVQEIERRTTAYGVGFLVREGSVRQALRLAAVDVMNEYKRELVSLIEKSIKDAIHSLKSEVQPV